jgi:hypothetical protein
MGGRKVVLGFTASDLVFPPGHYPKNDSRHLYDTRPAGDQHF